jgi:hypothetical protein
MRIRLGCWKPFAFFHFSIILSGFFAMAATAETIWIPASDATRLSGPISTGSGAGLLEEGALGEFLLPTTCVSEEKLGGAFAEFRVTIPRKATYYVWARLRYPFGLEESFMLAVADEKPTADLSRCLGNSGVEVDRWHWDSRGTGREGRPGAERLIMQLDQGEFRFRIYPRVARASVYGRTNWTWGRLEFMPRLNVLCLTTDPAFVPTDADARQALKIDPAHYADADFQVRPTILPPLSADDWQQAGKRPLPDWLRCPRFYVKDSSREEMKYARPGQVATMVRQAAANEANAFRMTGFWGGEAYYQSKAAPHVPGLGTLDFLREATEEGRRTGVKIVMYVNPNCLYQDHPLCGEAAVRMANGKERPQIGYTVAGTRNACFNNPQYRKFLLNMLTEAFTQYDLAGLYVDGFSQPRCFCRWCREKYEKMHGEPMPVEKLDSGKGGKNFGWGVNWGMVSRAEPPENPADPQWQRYAQFICRDQADITRDFSDAVKRARPGAVTLFHSWPKPDSAAWYDGTLTEVFLRRPWRHVLWKQMELANYSNIHAVPVLFNIYLHDHGTPAEGQFKSVQGLSTGCYPAFWNLLGMKPLFRFLRENSQYYDFARTRPAKFLGFVRRVNESAAEREIIAGTPSKLATKSDRFLGPYVGMYAALTRRGLPIVTLQAADFHERLAGFRVLCLANEACLSDEQVEAVRRFVADGGGLVATHETSLYDQNGVRRKDFGLADVFGVHYEKMLPAAQRRIAALGEHPVTRDIAAAALPAHNEPHLLVTLAEGECLARLVSDDAEKTAINAPPAIVVHSYGKGRVVYLPGRWDGIQSLRISPAIEKLFSNAAGWAAGEPLPVKLTASAPIAVSLMEQPSRRILHLVNLQGDTLYRSDAIEPTHDVQIQMTVPNAIRPTRVHSLWNKEELPFTRDGDRISFQLKKIDFYEVIVVE